MKWIEMISIALWFRVGSKSSILPVVFQTINWLSTWIVESDAGTYSHRFHQELIIQRLAVSHATTPTAHLFYSSFLPRFTVRPMGRRKKKHMKKTHTKTRQNERPRFHANNGANIHQNENQQERPQQSAQTSGNKAHKITVSVEVDCNLWFWGESWFGFESRKRCESVCCPFPCSGRWKDHQWSEISSRRGWPNLMQAEIMSGWHLIVVCWLSIDVKV